MQNTAECPDTARNGSNRKSEQVRGGLRTFCLVEFDGEVLLGLSLLFEVRLDVVALLGSLVECRLRVGDARLQLALGLL